MDRRRLFGHQMLQPVANSSAQLLDSGDLVLRDNASTTSKWRSFKQPSNAFVPIMKLGVDVRTGEKVQLTSWKSPSDPSDGNFLTGINPLNIPEAFIWNSTQPYWRSGPWNGLTFIGVPRMSSIYLDGFNLVDDQVTSYLIYAFANASYLSYFALDSQGKLMELYWDDGKGKWDVEWSSLETDCDVYGKCGAFGSCDSQKPSICSCLRGFEPKIKEEWDSKNWTSGCVRSTPLQCEKVNNGSEEGKIDGFLKLQMMKVPAFAERSSVLEDKCGDQCLNNCSCMAYAYDAGIGCMLWSGNLIDIQQFSTGGIDLYIRVASSELGKLYKTKHNSIVIIVIPVILGIIIITISTFFFWRWMAKQRAKKKKSKEMLLVHGEKAYKKFSSSVEDKFDEVKLQQLPLLKFGELATATSSFHLTKKLGQGGFGPVYRGILQDGKEVAVKRLSRASGQGLEEFMNEVMLISKLQHRNLVRLLGCCVEGEEKMLYHENGKWERKKERTEELQQKTHCIHSFFCSIYKIHQVQNPVQKGILNWRKRFNIIEGISRGLLYLHRDSRLKIIHRDLKASNILLDKELNPKISDFGMARIFGGDKNQAKTTRVVGTYGYMSPEYAMQGRFSEKSDVFSYGVLLLEIVSGRKNTGFYDHEHSISLLGYVWKLWNEDNVLALIDPVLSDPCNRSEILRCIHVGLLCVQEFAEDRPTVSTVISMLNSEIVDLPTPKQPAFTARPIASEAISPQSDPNQCSINKFHNSAINTFIAFRPIESLQRACRQAFYKYYYMGDFFLPFPLALAFGIILLEMTYSNLTRTLIRPGGAHLCPAEARRYASDVNCATDVGLSLPQPGRPVFYAKVSFSDRCIICWETNFESGLNCSSKLIGLSSKLPNYTEPIMNPVKWLVRTLLLFFLSHLSISTDTITIDHFIKDGDVIVSTGNIFAFGFFSPGSSMNRYVGIWYNQVPEKTVVWVANRENPINDSSGILSIDSRGNLALFKRNQTLPVWSTNVSVTGTGISIAQLLDSGNLVLLQNDTKRAVLWQSFDYPTNTLLPYMKLGLNFRTGLSRVLTSWKSSDDPGIGSCCYRVDPSGFPQFYLYKGTAPLWRAGTWTGQRWSGVPTMTRQHMINFTFVNTADEVSFTFGITNASIITRTMTNETGIQQRFLWNNQEHHWIELWSAPKERCDSYGHCGPNGYCNPDHSDAFECTCFPGFEPKSPQGWYIKDATGGCVRKHGVSTCRNGEGFVKMAHVKVPDTSAARADMSLGLKECKEKCWKDCSCVAFSSAYSESKGGIGCLNWHGNLVDARTYADAGQDLYIRVDADELARYTKKSLVQKKGVLAALIVSAAVVFLIVVAFLHWLVRKQRRGKRRQSKIALTFTTSSSLFEDSLGGKEIDESRRSADLPFFDLSIIAEATNNFSSNNKLGQGGFGPVYKGVLFNGKEIAVKRLSKYSGQGVEEFKNEIVLISKLQHRNLVRILGCCIEGEEKMLIYEYLPNKSLDSIIFDESKKLLLDWRKRFEIICGVARGILYLHQDSRLRIIHRDLKASNVLLDASMNPKISDFGMARIFRADQIEGNTIRVVGTYGYMSPEYAMQGHFSMKSDVYSFGVLLLEIITGRKNSIYYPDSPSSNLVGHVWDLWKDDKAMEVVDSALGDSYPADELLKCIQIGLLCVQEHATDRPMMSEVVFMLANETALPSPKQPAFIMKKACKGNEIWNSEGTCSVNDVTVTMVHGR
ncbi:LOW QUALITY PROTEIN: uncharacterized protein LOC111278491 [Durio zibethinus]|uniref:non-specific serine/threonine protein kinase n=1 Tax=Durio zibethinus TaxID=66656 RepID=A0A6P5WZ68_DURZI|nr:LOW QUALITY PROTEIN: uncharacterized protein LOC111278491 [Durio zibethinus]